MKTKKPPTTAQYSGQQRKTLGGDNQTKTAHDGHLRLEGRLTMNAKSYEKKNKGKNKAWTTTSKELDRIHPYWGMTS